MNKNILGISLITGIFLVSGSTVTAAVPDGVGPWADEVISFSQGLTKGGAAVAIDRSNPSAALGIAEGTNASGSFVSLGFGGELVLRFDNPVTNGVFIVEATNGTYPNEVVNVELSEDGVTYTSAGTVTFDGAVSLQGDACTQFVRLTDVTDSSIHEANADGFDVDGVRLEGTPCDAPVVPFFGPIQMAIAGVGAIGTWGLKRFKK